MTTWVDLVARARGLATHLLAEDALVELGPPELVERAARDRAAAELAILERWAADRTDALTAIVDDEDRRSLRGLVRGLAAATPLGARLGGAVPTSRLPAATLRDLAAQPTAAALAARLAHHAHPAATALAAPLAHTPLDLLAVEQALAGWFATRARRGARADRALALHVAQVIDVENAGAARLLAARGRALDAAAHFLPGGARLSRTAFLAAATAAPPIAATAVLVRAFAGTPLATALDDTAVDAVERAALAWHLATQRQQCRLEPLGLAPVLALVLRRRAETRRLRHAAWRVALGGAP